MPKTIEISDEALAAFAALGIDPEKDLAARITTIQNLVKRKQDDATIAKLRTLTDVERAPIAAAIDAAIDSRPKPAPAEPAQPAVADPAAPVQ